MKEGDILDTSCILVIFGGTGDLTHRKLLPAIYNLKRSQNLPDNFAIVSIGRKNLSSEEYREQIYLSLKKYSKYIIEDIHWDDISKRLFYKNFNFNDIKGYSELKTFLEELDKKYKTSGNRIFYLAVAPEYFDLITDNLHKEGLVKNTSSFQRLIIEKPFGRDLSSARKLNRKITEVFSEENIYRIDHYLGKEMIQSLMVLRFANSIFEPLWNNKYIDNIQISSSETVGVENRGGYYDEAGALKDMVQNHMLQLLTLCAMEPPINLTSSSIKDEKVKILRSLEKITPEKISKDIIRGQYIRGIVDNKEVLSYREEDKVSPVSNTETFVALKLHVENFRWAGVPFYIRTGKRMKNKSTEIVIQFKSMPKVLYGKSSDEILPNLLVIRVQPMEGIFFQFNTKKPGTENIIIPVQMDFCQNCQFGINTPEAYERLLYDAMNGDSTLFTSWDEVEYSWKFVDIISDYWKNNNETLYYYESGSLGPQKAEELLLKENHHWWNI
ncbi:glucose-6-phosphate dehydrogenase [Clostridium sp. USBA 49]|uniref:glucose-6-phosphate dehydrogenase n=1 Tax=Clostridium sp. USBA 49 TaxID=1881060 RepID=UPI000998F56E|nr:glucose-6-phosphate dehydrogenase [Clostridium sp. USBA 49]